MNYLIHYPIIFFCCFFSSEMVSPRCQSRNSSHEERCASEESTFSQRDLLTNRNTMSPVTISLTSSLSQAAALLPQHSAAMAAYLEVAAAAVHQNRLALASPMGDHHPSTLDRDEILDFSRKDTSDGSDSLESKSDNGAVNLSNKTENSPLDLSVSNRKRNTSESPSPQPVPRKLPRLADYKSAVTPWTSPITPQLPYFAAAVVAASLSPKNNGSTEFNVKNKMASQPSETNKALEKMSELSRLSGNEMYRPSNNSTSSGGRHSAWQSHWLNKGADSAKDVLKCVWCKESFPSLAAMTTHMKETKHCGVNVPPISSMHSNTPHSQSQPINTTPTSSNSNSTSSKQQLQNQNDFNLLIKETMPLPRKLVRGQDVWLGKGAEQTRQILKCMWCGQSFRTLAEMTTHMQHTQHYTNIISQEQIISWRSSDDKGSTSGGGPNSTNPNAAAHISHVSAVLTCKVCDQAFSSLKELSNHMVKNAHYKEHIMRSITESGGRRRQTREKRKKSLPVRKLLELERAQQDYKNGDDSSSCKSIRDLSAGRITCEKCNEKIDTTLFVEHIRQCVGGSTSSSPAQKLKSVLMGNTIIPPSSLSPIALCKKESIKNEIISSPMSGHSTPPHTIAVGTDLSTAENTPSTKKSCSPSVLNALEMLIEKSFDTRPRHSNSNFNQNQSSTPLGSSILKRLGIDESVDYTKPLVDSQTMNLLRNYHQQQYAHFDKRERSGSESSSISERCSSRLDSVTPEKKFDMTSTPCGTPDKYLSDRNDDMYESKDDDKVKIKNELTSDDDQSNAEDEAPTNLKIKREYSEEDEHKMMRPPSKHNDNNDDMESSIRRRNSFMSSPPRSPRPPSSNIPISPALSPASDHHSSASRSTPSNTENKITSSSGSLGALSSMFDNLTGSNSQILTDSSGKPKKNTAHPLAALQKLCDKTENTPNHRGNATQNSTLLSATSNASNSRHAPSSMLAHFSGDSGEDSTIKCNYCDTTVNSKNEYRHHLAKVHFINEDQQQQQQQQHQHHSETNQSKSHIKSQPLSPQSPKITNSMLFPNFSGNGTSNTASTSSQQNKSSPIPSPSAISVQQPTLDESPHSKFLKYTELAKQLSSKYV
jgi:teashirt